MEPGPTDVTNDASSLRTETARAAAADDAGIHDRPLNEAPPMSAVAVFSGLAAMLIMRVLVPSRDVAGPVATWELVHRLGTFAVNISAIAAMVALVLGLLPWLRRTTAISTRRRLLIATFGGMLLPVWLRAVFFARESMTGAMASLGAATACSLCTLLVITALRNTRARWSDLLPVALVVTAAVSSLLLLTLRSLAMVAPFSRIHGLNGVIAIVGELAYLGVMFCALMLVPRGPLNLRTTLAWTAGALSAAIVAAGFTVAASSLGRDFAIALYYAQHVTWLLDGPIALYAVPLAVGIGSAIAAVMGTQRMQQQLGVAVLAWIAAGFAPRAPWRFTLLALAGCLIARAIAARMESAEEFEAAAAAATTPSRANADPNGSTAADDATNGNASH